MRDSHRSGCVAGVWFRRVKEAGQKALPLCFICDSGLLKSNKSKKYSSPGQILVKFSEIIPKISMITQGGFR